MKELCTKVKINYCMAKSQSNIACVASDEN